MDNKALGNFIRGRLDEYLAQRQEQKRMQHEQSRALTEEELYAEAELMKRRKAGFLY